ncbi:MAG: hypothetical protein Q4C47_08025, partial [Planctomycetia bacterium]|nr:hypothetical protein [Planctomycetia bacterium]
GGTVVRGGAATCVKERHLRRGPIFAKTVPWEDLSAQNRVVEETLSSEGDPSTKNVENSGIYVVSVGISDRGKVTHHPQSGDLRRTGNNIPGPHEKRDCNLSPV